MSFRLARGLATSARALSAPAKGAAAADAGAAGTAKSPIDLLAQLTARPKAAAPAPRSAPHDAARGMIGAVGLRDLTIDDRGRKPFGAHKIIPPHAYTEDAMYGDRSPSARPPLLGPPKKIAKRIDPFLLRKSDPLEHAANPLMAAAFVNQLGMIKSRAETGLGWKSQRKVGKMVRRARAMGILSRWSSMPRPNGLGYWDWRNRNY